MKKDNWIIKAFLMTFFIALIFSAISNVIVIFSFISTTAITGLSIIPAILILLLVIFIGIFFDIIGTAVLTANEASFHAKSSKKIKGSKEGVYLVKNSSTISSICNDVIGDICGIVSGSVAAMLSILVSNKTNFSLVIVTLLISSLVSSLTVGGKAIGKKFAIRNSDNIIFMVAKVMYKFKFKK